jgi:3-methyladenine DNA glycosylase AlkD
MNQYKQIKALLEPEIKNIGNDKVKFYKTNKGDYAENDQFIGVKVGILRKIAKEFKQLEQADLQLLLYSPINEERLLALLIIVSQYQIGDLKEKELIYQYYLHNLKQVNNWNLVDSSAHLIMGVHLLQSNKDILISLAKSKIMWERRIAIIATWHFIAHNQFEWTIKIAEILLKDNHDLIHKACGWMLREVGKKDKNILINFLDKYATTMPRTMLRYAIEKFSKDERQYYLKKIT